MQLAGMSERTQLCYTRSVRMLVDFYHKTPDLINEQELQDYFLHLYKEGALEGIGSDLMPLT
ncbi:MAG: phage integrase N-terminal SAM-like domain-containing protein [Desulfobacterales bacterium]